MMIDKLGIVGSGNVGSALLMQIAAGLDNHVGEVTITARDDLRASAAVMDAGSAFPEQSQRFKAASSLEGHFDVVIVTAGGLPGSSTTLLDVNEEIARASLKFCTAKTLIVIGTPVDRLTERLVDLVGTTCETLIGFGGQLDQARMQFAMLQLGITGYDQVYAIGEHGPRTIPTYIGEERWAEVAAYSTTTLKSIMAAASPPRNLATGVQLSRLLKCLAGEPGTLCFSTADPNFDDLSITWPYEIKNTKPKRLDLDLGPMANEAVDNLIKTRRQEAKPRR